jgi:hypothetical protein
MDEIVCKEFQSSYLQRKKRLKFQSTAQGKNLEKWCTLNYFKRQGSKGCNILKQRK